MAGRRRDVNVLAHAAVLVTAGVAMGEAVRQLVARHGVTDRTAKRYVDWARKGELHVPEPPTAEVKAMKMAVAALPLPHQRGQVPLEGETMDEFRLRWARRLEAWVATVEAELDSEEGIIIGYKEHGGTKDSAGELIPIRLNRPAAYGRMVKVVERIHKLVGADAPQQVHVTGVVAHGHAVVDRDPLSMSPAERRREIEELRKKKELLASGSIIDVESKP